MSPACQVRGQSPKCRLSVMLIEGIVFGGDSSVRNRGLESCAMNSQTLNGVPSGRSFRTSRVAFPVLTTGASLNGIFWVLRSGAPWRDLPESYGPRTTCYNRFVRWRQAGTWEWIMV